MNYKIITDPDKLQEFIDWLPELQEGEIYYVALFARKKYCSAIKGDKAQIKRFTSNKEFLYDKIKQLECEVGCYKLNNTPIPNEALALYISPNPRSLIKASKVLTKKLLDLVLDKYSGYNPQAEALNVIQVTGGKTVFMDFDFDNTTIEEMKPLIFNIVNENAITFVQTKNGFHLLIEISKLAPEYEKNYYNNIVKLPFIDVRGSDGLLPVVGCCQSTFTPILYKN